MFISGQEIDRGGKENTTFCVGIDSPPNYKTPRHADGCDNKAPYRMGVIEPRSEACFKAMREEIKK